MSERTNSIYKFRVNNMPMNTRIAVQTLYLHRRLETDVRLSNLNAFRLSLIQLPGRWNTKGKLAYGSIFRWARSSKLPIIAIVIDPMVSV